MNYRTTARIFAVAALVALVPLAAAAQSFTANLNGDAGSGFASIAIAGETIDYSILFSGLEGATEASITNGSDVTIVLTTDFTGGSASGQTTSSDAPQVAASPADFSVEVTNGTDTLSGVLMGASSAGVVIYQPVVATVRGLAGTNFKTDVRMVNRSGADATVTIDYYARSNSGQSAPNETAQVVIPNNGQAAVDNFLETIWGITDGQGALVVTSDREITSSARIFNDQIDAGLGTFGQYSQALPISHAWSQGVIPFLSNVPSGQGSGFRSNIGWFNPNADPIEVTFSGYAADGTLLGQVTADAPGYQQLQVNVADLWPALSNYPDPLYVHYVVTGGDPVLMYGSVVDNVNGDASFVNAIPTMN
jgi:hypothetical protein